MNKERDQAGDALQLVTFYIGDDHFGLPISEIRDVFAYSQLTRVPMASGAIAGLFNLRGRIVTMMSMRALLGQAAGETDEKTRAIGIDRDGDSYGLIVDRMGEVMNTKPDCRENVPANLARLWGEFAVAVHRQPEGLLIELSVGALLGHSVQAAA